MPQRKAADPFRYDAVVFPSGEIDEIVESIGRRHLRRLKPASREGRRLLHAGQVRLWRGDRFAGDRVPLVAILGELRAAIEREQARHPEDDRWAAWCCARRTALDAWQDLYDTDH